MKKLIIFLLLLSGFFAYPNSPSANTAQVLNLSEVLSELDYPLEARRNGVEGRVNVKIKLDANGEIVQAEFLSSPSEAFRLVVEEALPSLQFEAAKNAEGQPIESSFIIPIEFKLTID